MLRVNEHGILWFGGLDPGAGVFNAACILGDGNDLEVFVIDLAVKFLPSRQIKTAASPRRPSEQ